MNTTRSTAPLVKKNLSGLRALMRKHGIAAYIIPSTDAHQSEYVPACWQRRAYFSGFTGSAGDVVVTLRTAGLWTDGRYYLQATNELADTGITLFKAADLGTPKLQEWLAATLKKGEAVGFDPRLLSLTSRREITACLEAADVKVKPIEANLVDALWEDQPPPPASPVKNQSEALTGESTAQKLKRVREVLKEKGAQAHVVTTLDAIAWLFNLRGNDVAYNPFLIAYAIVEAKKATLYIDLDKVPKEVKKTLGAQVKLQPYDALAKDLRELGKKKQSVLLDPASCNSWIADRLKGARLVEQPSPVAQMKSRKNATEIAGIKAAHVRDGAAMVRFLTWLDSAVPQGNVTEKSASDYLERLRREVEHFQDLSFCTISSYGGHGAIIHYSVTDETDVPLKPEGIYLIDSGGQYLDGTTDITRTVLLGKEATPEQKDRFTRVLLGHIRLARAIFPAGVAGIRLDTFARMALWQAGLDYGHGTGHGVGAYLSVHEGPISISVRGLAHIEEGNILSNEPGFYSPDNYGIRIENLVVVRPATVGDKEHPFFCFDTITLCPIDRRLIDITLLNADERAWLNDYHKTVRDKLSPLLGDAERRWLDNATKPL
jgi:Xaa-Pro aminopeptidase